MKSAEICLCIGTGPNPGGHDGSSLFEMVRELSEFVFPCPGSALFEMVRELSEFVFPWTGSALFEDVRDLTGADGRIVLYVEATDLSLQKGDGCLQAAS